MFCRQIGLDGRVASNECAVPIVLMIKNIFRKKKKKHSMTT